MEEVSSPYLPDFIEYSDLIPLRDSLRRDHMRLSDERGDIKWYRLRVNESDPEAAKSRARQILGDQPQFFSIHAVRDDKDRVVGSAVISQNVAIIPTVVFIPKNDGLVTYSLRNGKVESKFIRKGSRTKRCRACYVATASGAGAAALACGGISLASGPFIPLAVGICGAGITIAVARGMLSFMLGE